MARPIARLKLGYFPLPIEEAQNIRRLLLPAPPYAAIEPCAGDGTALIEITKDTAAGLAGIELDADRAATAAQKGIATVHGSTFECRVLAETCSLLYLNPPYDCEFGPHSNKRMELVFLEHCYRWVASEGVLVFVVPAPAVGTCARLLATFRCKIALPEKLIRCTSGDSSSLRQRVLDCSSQDGMSTAAFLGGLRDQPTSHVNEVVGDDPEPHPSLHSISPVVAATRQPVPPLDHADPAFTSRAPLLASLEPALLLPLAPFLAPRTSVGNRNVLHAQSVRAFFVGARVITRIRRHPSRCPPQLAPMRFHRRKQQVPITGPLRIDLVMRNDLVLRFLQLQQLAELVGLACLPLADDLGVRLKQADQLSRKLGHAVEDPRLGLPHHPAHLLGHAFQPFAQLAHPAAAAGRQSLDLLQHAA